MRLIGGGNSYEKIIELLSILFLLSITFVGCSVTDENNAKKVAEQFGRNLYTVDSKKVTDYNSLSKIGTIQSFAKMIQAIDKTIQPLMTEKGYTKQAVNN